MKKIDSIKNDHILNILFDIKECLISIYGEKLKDIILYGSYARGDFDSESDVDIMIIVDEKEEELKKYRKIMYRLITDISLKNNILISVIDKDIDEFTKYIGKVPFYNHLYSEGIGLYGE